MFLPAQLREAGVDIVVHDDKYSQTERDPLIFYECGKAGLVVLTSDKEFMKSFPHMAAIVLGTTTVLAFSNNKKKGDIRGKAFLAARAVIEHEVAQRRGQPFIGVIGMNGSFHIVTDRPLPNRKQCDPRDWESYRKVCEIAGVLAFVSEEALVTA